MAYPDWERSRDSGDQQSPETGRWDPRHERWIPQQRVPEGDDYGIEPFHARTDPYGPRPGQGRVLDHDDYRTGEWTTGRQRRYEPEPPPRRRPGSPGEDYYAVRPRGRPAPPRQADDEDDELDERSNYIGSFIATAGWYVVPILAYTIWALTLSGDPREGCVDPFGVPCPAPRTEALTNLLDNGPQFAVSLALSISVAMFLGWATSGWRPTAIGFASAVLGAGVATVLFAVLATQF
ncbi:hypothetical protein GCM10010399_16450 [Dactylosporangium fulvum]|uniref:Integral membrane protein n=1 Tax=Dactylosporangium fulvum TaxID=53359 RepID=A0ABY5VZX2_9ACTN|nr:hypothetical protein [Dactylosporangium fulvum]UWP82719.1 hypothetical protein Dfulv_48175 [Dactylosporangium fulvum]